MLRFPGDWVGPLEDLVPFGPSADRESGSAMPDFWGEDSAVLQDAVEAPEQPRPPHRQRLRVRRWLLPAGAALAAVLYAVAAFLGGTTPTAPHPRAVPFAIASIPPLAPAAPAVKKHVTRHRTSIRPRSHPKPPRTAPVSTRAIAVSSPVTTPAWTYRPAPTVASSGSSSSQSGGAFTLGGP